MQRASKYVLASLLFVAACGPAHIMKLGRFHTPLVLDTPELSLELHYIKSGTQWTNVWIDMNAGAKGGDANFDPNDFELFDTLTKTSYRPSMRQFIAGGIGFGFYGGFMLGSRPDTFGWGLASSSPPMMVHAGTNVQASLVFETPPHGAKDLTRVDLVYRGVHMPLHVQ